MAGNESLHSLSMFPAPKRPGFGGRQAFSKNKDLFYASMQSTTSGTVASMKRYDHPVQKGKEQLEAVVIAFPTIVIDGDLFETYFDNEKGALTVSKVDTIRMHWEGADAWSHHATIDLVTKESFKSFIEKRYEEFEILLKVLEPTVKQLKECLAMKSLKPLAITEGPRGIIGLPAFLAKIKAIEDRPRSRVYKNSRGW